MNLFMMWMWGNDVGLMNIIMLCYMSYSPIKALLNVNNGVYAGVARRVCFTLLAELNCVCVCVCESVCAVCVWSFRLDNVRAMVRTA